MGSAANYTGDIVFERLGIKVEQVFQNNALAIEAMRRGELAGIVHVVGKPNDLFSKLKPEPGFHFLPMEYGDKFADYYVPAELTSADYPNLIPAGQSVQTISVSALLAVYNWKSDTDRYRRCVRFIEYLFNRFDKLREQPYQPGWRQINLAGTIPGWTRFPADAGADRQGAAAGARIGRCRPGAPAGGARGTQQRGRAGAPVPRVPGVEQAAEAIMRRAAGVSAEGGGAVRSGSGTGRTIPLHLAAGRRLRALTGSRLRA